MTETTYQDSKGNDVRIGDLVIWRTRGHVENPLLVGYLHFDDYDECYYIGDEYGYPRPTGYMPEDVLRWGVRVGNLSEIPRGED